MTNPGQTQSCAVLLGEEIGAAADTGAAACGQHGVPRGTKWGVGAWSASRPAALAASRGLVVPN